MPIIMITTNNIAGKQQQQVNAPRPDVESEDADCAFTGPARAPRKIDTAIKNIKLKRYDLLILNR